MLYTWYTNFAQPNLQTVSFLGGSSHLPSSPTHFSAAFSITNEPKTEHRTAVGIPLLISGNQDGGIAINDGIYRHDAGGQNTWEQPRR